MIKIFIFENGFGGIRFTTQAETKEGAFALVCNYVNRRVESDKDEEGGFDSEHWISESSCDDLFSGKFNVIEVTGSVHLSYT